MIDPDLAETYKNISVDKIVEYLKSNNWIQIEEEIFSEDYFIFALNPNSFEFEVLVPRRKDFKDYGIRMHDAIRTMAEVENQLGFKFLEKF